MNAEKIATVVSSERQAFALRLRGALDEAGITTLSPSKIMRGFNARSTKPVTLVAVKKWLDGESFPTQERLMVIALWLDCDAGWLRFGETASSVGSNIAPSPEYLALLQDLSRLDKASKTLVQELVKTLRWCTHHSTSNVDIALKTGSPSAR